MRVWTRLTWGVLVAATLFASAAVAHTSEIFFAEANAANSENKPAANVLFLLDTSGSMEPSRMPQLKQAFNIVVDNLNANVRIGIGKFNGGYDRNGYGGYVFYPVQELTDARRTEIKRTVGGLRGTSNTPTMEAYSEMARYMLGMPPGDYAKVGEAITETPARAVNISYDQCASRDYWGGCVGGWVSADTYQSPVNMRNQCETNHIIVMTDGDPTQDSDYGSVRSIAGGTCNSSYACQEALAAWLYNSGKSTSTRKSIRTWQVALGGAASTTRMDAVAAKGGTESARQADNAEELAKQFTEILDLISEESRSISAPGVAVNQMSRLQHLGQLYYSVFQPETTTVWQGNLKRYQLEQQDQGAVIVDAAGRPAVDPATGYFSENSRSYWSSAADGPDATKGGARERLGNRRLYYIDEDDRIVQLTLERLKQVLRGQQGTQALDRLGLPDSNVTVTAEEFYAKLMNMWADPLHSVPVLVNYDASGPDEKDQKNYVFVSTNGGMLHAINPDDGKEQYAIMPFEIVRRAYEFAYPGQLNADNTRPLYGLDGSWIAWRRANKPGTNEASAIYLYGGMRRGGRHYYAMDVSDPAKPAGKLLWHISNETEGFGKLGETWSTPTLIQLKIGGKNVPALVFGGGYDPSGHDKQCSNANMCMLNEDGTPAQDYNHNYCASCNDKKIPELSSGRPDRMGNAIYIVNALTGELIWSASKDSTAGVAGAGHTQVNDMHWAIPAGIAVVDSDLDGYPDHFYVGDLGAQIFRVDLNREADRNDGIVSRVVRLANLNEGGTSGARRFFEAPAVGYVKENNQPQLVVSIVSGYRVHPLETRVEERVYVVKDETAFQAREAGYQFPGTIGIGQLGSFDNMGNITDSELAGKKGWWFGLEKNGEKGMSSPTIYNGRLMFTTYSPDTGDQEKDPCKVRYGTSYLYVVDLMTSKPRSLNDDDILHPDKYDSESDRRRELDAQVPVSSPQVIATGNDDIAVLVGTEVISDVDSDTLALRKRRWYPLDRTAANEFIKPASSSAGNGDD